MDLGFRSDPNMHRAHCGSSRVRIEARQRVGGAKQDFWKSGLERISTRLFVTERIEQAGWKKRTEELFKDGRHVGLDFYDLLIEAA